MMVLCAAYHTCFAASTNPVVLRPKCSTLIMHSGGVGGPQWNHRLVRTAVRMLTHVSVLAGTCLQTSITVSSTDTLCLPPATHCLSLMHI